MNDGILVLTLIMVIVLAILALTLNKYAAFWYKVMVADQFALINSIMTTEEVPMKWRIKVIESLVRKNKPSFFWRKIDRLLVKWYIFRLDRLVNSIKTSSLIKDPDKLEYIEAFKDIRAAWNSSSDLD